MSSQSRSFYPTIVMDTPTGSWVPGSSLFSKPTFKGAITSGGKVDDQGEFLDVVTADSQANSYAYHRANTKLEDCLYDLNEHEDDWMSRPSSRVASYAEYFSKKKLMASPRKWGNDFIMPGHFWGKYKSDKFELLSPKPDATGTITSDI